jgi:DICT domain-containing protein/signal transduction histidine kinase
MSIVNSLLLDLLQEFSHLRSQTYFKSSLTALSHAIEDIVLSDLDSPLVIANFQQERFYRQEIRRYRQIAQKTNQLYILAVPESESGFAVDSESYETIPLKSSDSLAQEWNLVIVGQHYTACLACREILETSVLASASEPMRRFEGIWTFDRQISRMAARLLLGRIANYRQELASKVEEAWQHYGLTADDSERALIPIRQSIDTEIFAQRLVTYLQASQYKLLKAYRVIATQERNQRLINAIATAMRASLNPQAVLAVAVKELGQCFENCRCLLYRFSSPGETAKIEYEWKPPEMLSLKGENWSLADNPFFVAVQAQERAIAINDVANNPYLQENSVLKSQIERASIQSWLLVPIRDRDNLLGMLELHYGGSEAYRWQEEDISLVEAIATQAGVALTQAQAYTHLSALNRQLEAVERSQSNLIAIVGHELRTPLSTIQVCLESLASEPDMATEFRQKMLEISLGDSERMRQLIQDFLTLSKLESGQYYSRPEVIELSEALELALSSFKTSRTYKNLPLIQVELPNNLPLLQADGDGLVQVFAKLLDNACKFTAPDGQIAISAQILNRDNIRILPLAFASGRQPMLEVIVADTGRGIDANQLEAIFDSFYQAEDWLRRTVGGTGLGLAICRQIIQEMGGQIWAFSAGKNRGSEFHFTVPIDRLCK